MPSRGPIANRKGARYLRVGTVPRLVSSTQLSLRVQRSSKRIPLISTSARCLRAGARMRSVTTARARLFGPAICMTDLYDQPHNASGALLIRTAPASPRAGPSNGRR